MKRKLFHSSIAITSAIATTFAVDPATAIASIIEGERIGKICP